MDGIYGSSKKYKQALQEGIALLGSKRAAQDRLATQLADMTPVVVE
jgi:hypothetical protein